jgi:hypothetical protein
MSCHKPKFLILICESILNLLLRSERKHPVYLEDHNGINMYSVKAIDPIVSVEGSFMKSTAYNLSLCRTDAPNFICYM